MVIWKKQGNQADRQFRLGINLKADEAVCKIHQPF
jgi:hypothetical protein